MADLSLTGTVKKVLDEQSGESRNGPWRKKEFILQTDGNYPKDVCIVQWGDNIDQFNVQEGERLTAHIDIASREYNGRWYTDVKAWRVERDSGQPTSQVPPDEDPFPPSQASDDPDDDLPF